MTDRNSVDLSEIRQIFALQQEERLDEKIKNVKTELEGDVERIKADLEGDLKTLKTDLEGDIEAAKEELSKRHDSLKWIVMALAAVGTIIVNLVARGFGVLLSG